MNGYSVVLLMAIVSLCLILVGSVIVLTAKAGENSIGTVVAILAPTLTALVVLLRQERRHG